MDNFHFDITSNGSIERWLELIMGNGRKAVGWSIHDDLPKGRRMIFYWVAPKPLEDWFTPLPAPADVIQVAALASGWLKVVGRGQKPDHDGDTGQGFRLYNEDWGHVDGRYQAFIAIAPAWAIYGK